MCNCLKRTEVETSHNTEMFKIFFLILILISAKERQDQLTEKISSQAFAHLHHISFVFKSIFWRRQHYYITNITTF